VHGKDSTVRKGLGVEAGRSLGLLVVPEADRVLCHSVLSRYTHLNWETAAEKYAKVTVD
jgi:hypothetical protein